MDSGQAGGPRDRRYGQTGSWEGRGEWAGRRVDRQAGWHRQLSRQAGWHRQLGRQAGGQTGRWADRQMGRQAGGLTDRWPDR
jgi:hypothetical protein